MLKSEFTVSVSIPELTAIQRGFNQHGDMTWKVDINELTPDQLAALRYSKGKIPEPDLIDVPTDGYDALNQKVSDMQKQVDNASASVYLESLIAAEFTPAIEKSKTLKAAEDLKEKEREKEREQRAKQYEKEREQRAKEIEQQKKENEAKREKKYAQLAEWCELYCTDLQKRRFKRGVLSETDITRAVCEHYLSPLGLTPYEFDEDYSSYYLDNAPDCLFEAIELLEKKINALDFPGPKFHLIETSSYEVEDDCEAYLVADYDLWGVEDDYGDESFKLSLKITLHFGERGVNQRTMSKRYQVTEAEAIEMLKS